MNNKGFAITSIIYGLMLLFVVVMTSLLSVLIGRNRRNDELLVGVRESLEYPEINIKIKNKQFEFDISNDNDVLLNEEKNLYVTQKRGKYIFEGTEKTNCEKFLPKNVVIITSEFREPGTSENKLYYKLGNEGELENVNSYEKLCD